jgi:hypothetical protein
LSVLSNEYPARPPPDTDERIEALTAACHVLAARVAELECSNVELRQAADLDPARPVISARTNWRSLKQVAGITGYSETQIRELIGQNRIVAEKHGGRWFVDVSAPMPHKLESAKARSSRAP